MSRAVYKGMRIEWYPDECCQPSPKVQYVSKKENTIPRRAKGASAMKNRFQMLNMDGNAEDDSEEESNEASVLSDLPSMHINHRSPWNISTVAA